MFVQSPEGDVALWALRDANRCPPFGRYWGILLQKSPRRSCGIEIRNNRIGANEFLNRCCAFTLDLDSILRARMRKIVLQHNRGRTDMRQIPPNEPEPPSA